MLDIHIYTFKILSNTSLLKLQQETGQQIIQGTSSMLDI